MPPPITPVQQRFLASSSRKSTTKINDLDGSSDNKSGSTKQTRSNDRDSMRGDAQEQFGIVPAFVARGTSRASKSGYTALSQATPARFTPAALEEVLDRSQSDVDEHDTMLLDELQEGEPWHDNLTHSPKRRRLIGPSDAYYIRPSAPPAFIKPSRPLPKAQSPRDLAIQRFRSPSQSIQGRLNNVPAFAASPGQVNATISDSPLPDAFSPQRKADNYVAGGVAAVMQQWIVETSQAASYARRAQRGACSACVEVDSIIMTNERLILLHGTIDHQREINLMLISGNVRHSKRVEPGMSIGVKEPSWQMSINGRDILVCADWGVT